ncbi:hypothetical protein B0H13DRAFT_1900884 [Mycena leptocephala]|nr:hypothetical protein B0H13DRAFT_1900884 [Mycena leptocephala]
MAEKQREIQKLQWFLEGREFREWRCNPGLLWLRGSRRLRRQAFTRGCRVRHHHAAAHVRLAPIAAAPVRRAPMAYARTLLPPFQLISQAAASLYEKLPYIFSCDQRESDV